MPSLMETLGIDRLSKEDRLRLADEIYESFDGEPFELTDEQSAELERRLKRVEAGEAKFHPWEEVYQRILSRVKQ